ncbi:MAG: FliM/FliN family flagellar motor C-terminal domain-containing protein [Rhizomicrobium sp.]
MTQGVEEWLPRDAFTDERLRAILSEPLARWRERWFVRGTVASLASLESDAGAAPAMISLAGSFAGAELREDGVRHLLRAALAIDPSQREANADDRAVLDGFVREIVNDLIAALDTALSDGGDDVGARRVPLAIELDDRQTMTLSLAAAPMAALIKRTVPSARFALPGVGARSEAVKATPVVLVGVLGSADLAVSDLDGIGVGDVLVLDRSVREPVELRLMDGDRALVRGRLSQKDGCAAIQL